MRQADDDDVGTDDAHDDQVAAVDPAATDSFMLAGARIAEEDLGGILMAVLVDNADGILILDAEGVIIAANPAAEQLFGRAAPDLVGTPLGQPVTSGVRTELEILSPRGIRYAELLSRSTTWRGSPAKVVTLRDSTDRRRAIDALRDYVSMTAHEIATPLTSISGFADTLTNSWDEIEEDNRRSYISIIRRQAARVAAISQDLLALSRLDSASMDHRAEPVDVAASVQQLLADGAAKDAVIEVKLKPGTVVMADPYHLETILRNFISNAAKYGQPPLVVTAVPVDGPKGQAIEIAVSDCGDGVPLNFIPHLYERFARAKRGVPRTREGTGLGLSLSQGLAELNEGLCGYRPNEPRGSTFTVTLPSGPGQ